LQVPTTHRAIGELDLRAVDAPLALCSADGRIEAASPIAYELMIRFSVLELPAALKRDLWTSFDRAPPGEAIEWRSPAHPKDVLGITRYAGRPFYLLLMREVSDKHAAFSRRLHRQRLEVTGRLVASIAHELRNSVASIVYSADFLKVTGSELSQRALLDSIDEIQAASSRLQLTVDGLLDYARLGPSVSIPVSLREVIERARSFLRSLYHEGGHALENELWDVAEWVRGNPLSVEQIFVNLLLNAAESASDRRTVRVSSKLATLPGAPEGSPLYVCARVIDDGPGIARDLRESIFEPFFTTKEQGTGLGLTGAREAAEALEGALVLEPTARGACFAVYLPRSERP
jgi:signal transduction histidine kinase